MNHNTLTILFLGLLSLTLPAARADWPEFRGPTGDGHVPLAANGRPLGLPLTWSESENIRWKTEIPHRGWSTPVVMDGKVWLTTATEDGHDYFVLCVDAATGKIIHNKQLFHSDNPEPLGNEVNCYAAPSPVIEPGRVYVHFGSYGTACLDTATGDVLWQRTDLPCRHYRGPSSSLVLFENLLIITMDGADLQYVTALDKNSGQNVWKTDRNVAWNDQDVTGKGAAEAKRLLDGDHRKAHSTPLIVTVDGQPLMLSGGAKAAFGYDPRTGRELWRVHFESFSVAPRPLFQNGMAYLVTGTTNPELWAVKTSGTGDVTDEEHVAWALKQRVPKTASPVLVNGLLYLVGDDGVASCVDASNGEIVWSKRIDGAYAASPIYADGRLYFCNRDGITTVLKPGRAFEVLATNTLDDGCMASPAVDGKALILRTKTHLYRIETAAGGGE